MTKIMNTTQNTLSSKPINTNATVSARLPYKNSAMCYRTSTSQATYDETQRSKPYATEAPSANALLRGVNTKQS